VGLLCWPWQRYSHGDGLLAVVQHDTRHGHFRCPQVSRDVVPVAGNCPGSLFAWSHGGAEGHDPDCWGRGTPPAMKFAGQDPCCGSRSVVGGIMLMSCRYVSGRWVSYPSALLCGVVLSMQRGAGLSSDQAEVTAVLSVLAGSIWRAYSCQDMCVWLGVTSSHPP
jgi:hypothetical protein